MIQEVPDLIVQTALSYTQTSTLTEALLAFLGTNIKKCANEKCQKEFIYQEPFGKRSPRIDAMYCSDICARRAAQRKYVSRRRAKARKENNIKH